MDLTAVQIIAKGFGKSLELSVFGHCYTLNP